MSVPNAVIVLQARMASRRLPGKAARLIAGRTLLTRCLDRLLAGGAAPVVLATTTGREDDPLVREATARGVLSVRGSEADVLGRFVLAASMTGARHVVRATGDNPAVDIDAPQRVLRVLVGSGVDYVGERHLPCGAGVEAVSAEALRRAHRLARQAEDREHVTTFVKRECEQFGLVDLEAPQALRRPDLRLTIDTEEDLRFMHAVLSGALPDGVEPSLQSIIESADRVIAGAVRA